MPRLTSTMLSLGLVPVLLALPTVTPPAAKPAAVPPGIAVLELAEVDESALEALQEGSPAPESDGRRASGGSLEGAPAAARAAAAAAPDPALLTAPLDTAPFSLVGVTWAAEGEPADSEVSVLVRVRENGGWSDWEALASIDEGPDAGTDEMRDSAARKGTDPLLTGQADGVQVRVDTPDGEAPRDLEVTLIDPGSSPADENVGGPVPTSTATASAPKVITRAQWGADESLAKDSPTNSTLKAVSVHHTASTNGYSTQSGAIQQLRSIYAYHTQSLGWSDIGYNFVVDKFGNAYEGRRGSIDRAVRGAHTGGFNVDTLGISGLGNYDTVSAPSVMVDMLARLAAWKLGPYGGDPQGKTVLTSAGGGTSKYAAGTQVTVNVIFPHREVGLTACPGQYLNGQMGTIRTKAKGYLPPKVLSSMSGESISARTVEYATGSLTFSANTQGDDEWAVTITPMCGRSSIRTFTGSTSPLSATWDLKTSTGAWASPGSYRVAYVFGSNSWWTDIEVLPKVWGPAGLCSTSRIQGQDRYATSVAEGRVAFPTGSDVVIVSGSPSNLVDGLVSGPLARSKKAPVLMVQPSAIPPVVEDDLRRRKPTTAWIVGGTGTVQPAVESELRALGVSNVRRLAGDDRFATAAKVALEVKAPHGYGVIASGRSLVDAVAAAGPAAATGRPVLLVEPDSVPPVTASTLRTLGVNHATVVGGTGAISEATRKALPLITAPRAAGSTRYSTAVAVATAFTPVVGTDGVSVASGLDANVADALAGAALGQLTVLVTPTSVPGETATWLSQNQPGAVNVLGGVGAVGIDTLRAVHVASRS